MSSTLEGVGSDCVWLCRQILDAIEANGFDNFTQRAYVKKWRKYGSLPLAFLRAKVPVNLLKEADVALVKRQAGAPRPKVL